MSRFFLNHAFKDAAVKKSKQKVSFWRKNFEIFPENDQSKIADGNLKKIPIFQLDILQ